MARGKSEKRPAITLLHTVPHHQGSHGSAHQDLEKAQSLNDGYLGNTTIQTFGWENIEVTVPERQTKRPKTILSGVSGEVGRGELLALMGPSGSGKTTLLNVLAQRKAAAKSTVKGGIVVNGSTPTAAFMRKNTAYVEQEDALIGSLTVEETLTFTARLALPNTLNKAERKERVQSLVLAFGLQHQRNMLIGTPIRKGISGGQKRRVSVAAQLITAPKVLFLDEPTSGLDSAASYEVMSFIRALAKKHGLLVIASIHQPSTSTFELFDRLLLLAKGRTVYNGLVNDVRRYFAAIGFQMPKYFNPAEFLLEIVNTDFVQDEREAAGRLSYVCDAWNSRGNHRDTMTDPYALPWHSGSPTALHQTTKITQFRHAPPNIILTTTALVHRSFLKSYRDVLAYGLRVAMYLGLAFMMGTVWLRLKPNQDEIQNFINAIFFGGAFMSFMAVAYVPSYLEEFAVFTKERANGLYGATSFVLANFITGVPYLFLISLLFSLVAYWLTGFNTNTAGAFWRWVMFLFLDLLAAEGLVVLIASLVPIFVVALAAAAFANGLWMAVGGFLVAPKTLNVFWRYVFHYIDYQAYVFQGMMTNEFDGRTYNCATIPPSSEGAAPSCQCMYTPIEGTCTIAGTTVLGTYGYRVGETGKLVGILIAIIFVYRVLGWVVLHFKRS